MLAYQAHPVSAHVAYDLDAWRRCDPRRQRSRGNRPRATGGRGADVVLDFVGENGTPALAIEIVRQGGTYLIVGYGELQVPTMLLILKEATIIGNLVGSYGDLSELIALAAAGDVELHTVQYDLEAAPQALDDLNNGRVNGRAVLIPSAR